MPAPLNMDLCRRTLCRQGDRLPEGVTFQSLGQHRLRDLLEPESIWQLNIPDLPQTFPPLKSLETFPNNLPSQHAPLIGRDAEVQDLLGVDGGKQRASLQHGKAAQAAGGLSAARGANGGTRCQQGREETGTFWGFDRLISAHDANACHGNTLS